MVTSFLNVQKRYLIIIIFAVFLLCEFYFQIISDTSRFIWNGTLNKPAANIIEKMNCHRWTVDDALVSTEDSSFSPGHKDNIFFQETSCRGKLNSRQACVIESAARLHPKRQINVLFNSPVYKNTLKEKVLANLLSFPNVKFARIHIDKYVKGTVVEHLFQQDFEQSAFPIEHAADILRIVTMNKYGGIYLDTDSMVIKTLDSLSANWIAKESNDSIASGAMGFSKDGVGANVTMEVLLEIRRTYSPSGWSTNGPEAIKRVLHRACPDVVKTGGDCKGVEIFTQKLFYPVHYPANQKYFKNGTIEALHEPYMHHMWNHLTHDRKIEKSSPYVELAREFCPTTYETFGDNFGD